MLIGKKPVRKKRRKKKPKRTLEQIKRESEAALQFSPVCERCGGRAWIKIPSNENLLCHDCDRNIWSTQQGESNG